LGDSVYITCICSGLKEPTMTPWLPKMLLVWTSVLSKDQLSIPLYVMSRGCIATLWSSNSAMSQSLLSESSRKFLISQSKVLKIYLQDLMESMACNVVSNTTSPSRLEISVASSLFLGAFLGAIMFVFRTNSRRREKCVSLLNAIHLWVQTIRMKFEKTKPLLTFNSSYDKRTETGNKTLVF